jgi:hypothetical protein
VIVVGGVDVADDATVAVVGAAVVVAARRADCVDASDP